MKGGKLVLIAVMALLALPSSASAFTVRLTGDDADANIGDGLCDSDDVAPGNQCTLRAATDEANAAPNNDSITFDHSVFTGNAATSTIILNGAIFADTEMTIDGGDCPGAGLSHRPCVGIDAASGTPGLELTGAGIDIRGLAIFSGSVGINGLAGSDSLTVRNSWLGLELDGDQAGNSAAGMRLLANSAVIGGTTGADRVVVAGNFPTGVQVDGDGNKLRGSYFGTKADGVTEVAVGSTQIAVTSTADGTVIGASIDSSHRTTPKCDGGCNVLAGGSTTTLVNSGSNTTIKGNFIGLDKTGLAALPTGTTRINESGAGTVIGGDTSAERNFINGASNGIAVGSTADDPAVKRNYIGLNSAGTGALGAPSSTAVQIASDAANPALVSRNRLAGASPTAMFVSGEGARVVRNKIGLDKDGDDLPGPSSYGIWVVASNSRIGEPDAGNTVGNVGSTSSHAAIRIGGSSLGGDGNTVQGNYIGTDSAGANHSNGGIGIHLINIGGADPADDNLIGGDTGASENVISNSGNDAIRLEDTSGTSTGNQFKRNRGKDNGDQDSGLDLFIDLVGDDGEGNGLGGPNDEIPDPIVQDGSDPGDLTRTHAEGFMARPNATIYIFRTSWPNTSSPPRINAFVTKVDADGDGVWSANFPQIPSGQRLTALQIDTNGNASELAPAAAP